MYNDKYFTDILSIDNKKFDIFQGYRKFLFNIVSKNVLPFYALTYLEATYYEKTPWTVDQIETMKTEFNKGHLIGLYEKENVDDIVK